jgi:hypothetical protein
MDGMIAALKDTPIPTILVVAGIVFLLLSIAGQLAGRIAVPPERQRQAAVMGGLLGVVGIALHVAPPLRIPRKASDIPPVPSPQPLPQPRPTLPPSSPAPAPWPEVPTKYDGVMARITRLATSGAFITLEITVKNGTKKELIVCGLAQEAQLFDQHTGDSWEPVKTGGDLAACSLPSTLLIRVGRGCNLKFPLQTRECFL